MSQSTVILCPGQGAQHVGMGKAWAESFDVARRTFDEADEVLGISLSDICFNGPETDVTRTDVAQAAIYVTTVACVRALTESGELPAEPAATAGLSLGEYTALHLAGAFSFADGLKLVRQRGQFMQEAAEAAASSMVALMGADEQQARELCERAAAAGDGVLVPANFNCPGQVVVSGDKSSCQRALELASEMGLRATELTVAGAFHSPFMQLAADRMAEALDGAEWSSPRCTVMSNVTGKPHDNNDIASIKKLLVDQIISPVRWADDVQWLIDNVSGRYVEPAPGKVLAGLMRRIDRKTRVDNFAEPPA